VRVLPGGTSRPAPESAANGAARRLGRVRVGDLLAVAGLVAIAGLIEFFLRTLLTRPFYNDEAWRAYDIARGTDYPLHTTPGPLALGWVGIENAARLVLGNTEAGLRAPMFLALPLLALATYWLARRWLGAGVSFCVAGLLLVNSWIVNYALQLKSDSYEGLLAIAAVALYLLARRTTGHPAKLLGLYAALGLTCVFSLPNLFVVAPLLALDLAEALRARDRVALRIGGEALAAAIALAHYVLFVRPQARIAGVFFHAEYAPHAPAAFVRFAIKGLGSYFPSMITGVAGGARSHATPTYALPPLAHHLLALVLVLLLAAGIVAAARDAAGRAVVVAAGGALLLELLASAVHRWPFGLQRQNIFVLPLVYVLGGIGAVALASVLRGPRPADGSWIPATWWRVIALGAAAVVLVAAGTAAGVATQQALAETSALQAKPTWFAATKAAVADTRLMATPSDLVIIRADRSPPIWYAFPWLYYMESYQGYPPRVAARPRIPARSTLPVAYVTRRAVRRFLAAHPGSPAVFLLEYILFPDRFPASAHQQSVTTLRGFGYCPTRVIPLPDTGKLTVLTRAGCAAHGAPAGG
jgi:4-amino-4-deoxy-L-arabinose transferase-like glycosyltransferase